jgi:hypothetical protein
MHGLLVKEIESEILLDGSESIYLLNVLWGRAVLAVNPELVITVIRSRGSTLFLNKYISVLPRKQTVMIRSQKLLIHGSFRRCVDPKPGARLVSISIQRARASGNGSKFYYHAANQAIQLKQISSK